MCCCCCPAIDLCLCVIERNVIAARSVVVGGQDPEGLIHEIIGCIIIPELAGARALAIDDDLGTAVVETAEVLYPGHQLMVGLIVEINICIGAKVLLYGGVKGRLYYSSRYAIPEFGHGLDPHTIGVEGAKGLGAVDAILPEHIVLRGGATVAVIIYIIQAGAGEDAAIVIA